MVRVRSLLPSFYNGVGEFSRFYLAVGMNAVHDGGVHFAGQGCEQGEGICLGKWIVFAICPGQAKGDKFHEMLFFQDSTTSPGRMVEAW